MYRVDTIAFALALSMTLLFGFAPHAWAAKTLKVTMSVPASMPPMLKLRAKALAKQLTVQSQGLLQVSTISIDDERLHSGNEDVSPVTFIDLADSVLPAVAQRAIFNALFAFTSLEDVERFQQSDAARALLEETSSGQSFWWHEGMSQLLVRERGLLARQFGASDLKLRLSLPPGNENKEQFSALGMEIEKDLDEPKWLSLVLGRLALGYTDVVELSWEEIAKQIGRGSRIAGSSVLRTNHRYRGQVLLISDEWLKSLPVELQATIKRVTADATYRHNQATKVFELELTRRVAASKVISYEVFDAGSRAQMLALLGKGDWAPDGRDPQWYGHVLMRARDDSELSSAWKLAFDNFKEIQRSWNENPPGITSIPISGQGNRRAPRPSAAIKQSAEVVWDTWLSRLDGEVAKAEKGKKYEVNLTIQRRGERKLGEVPADLKQSIDAAIAAGEKTLSLVVRPLALTSGISLGAGADKEFSLTLDVQRLKPLSDAEQSTADDQYNTASSEGASRVALSKMYNGGTIAIPITITAVVPCAQLLLSVWDESGTVPLDMVIANVPIKSETHAECSAPQLQGGFGSLLETPSKSIRFDASLSMFEFWSGESVRTVAIFVDAATYKAGSANAKLNSRGVYVWMVDSITGYMAGNLPRSILAARDDATYANPADDLRVTIFPPAAAPARLALAALKRIAAQKGTDALIKVRGVKSDGRYFYPPLALLASKGGALSKRPIFIFPLPLQRHAKTACVPAWTAVVPPMLDLTSVGTNQIALAGRMSHVPDMQTLRTYLSSNGPETVGMAPDSNLRTEGLLILAHHGSGNLWFSGNGAAMNLRPQDNNRRYAPGSVAIINACSTVNAPGTNQSLMESFNQHGMDAMLLTPFPMETTYGIEFTKAMVKAIHAAYAAGSTPTIVELFAQSAKNVELALPNSPLSERILELIFVGDPEIRICGKPN
jgi:TRAP-type C4-dicarboxylate transport system substrate-binding protein